MNVSAYTFDDSTKAFANIRLSITDVRPILQVDDEGAVIPSLARRVRTKEFQRTHQFLKMKFVVYKHVWEHIQDQNIVINRGLNVEAFALQLSDMYEELGKPIFCGKKKKIIMLTFSTISLYNYSFQAIDSRKLQSCFC